MGDRGRYDTQHNRLLLTRHCSRHVHHSYRCDQPLPRDTLPGISLIPLLPGAVDALDKPLLASVMFLVFLRYSVNGLYELLAPGSDADRLRRLRLRHLRRLPLRWPRPDHRGRPARTDLPFGRRGGSRQAFEGDLSEQVGSIEKQAGVRKQLQIPFDPAPWRPNRNSPETPER